MTERLQPGTPIYHWNDAGEVLGYNAEGGLEVRLDHSRYQDEKGLGKLLTVPEKDIEEDIRVTELASRDRYLVTTEPGQTPPRSAYGYMITEDGKVHTLLRRWTHGIALALLFPEHAKASGYRQPDDDSDVYHYQRYELDYGRDLPVVRIAFGMMTAVALSKARAPATDAQVEGVRLAFKACGIGLREEVSCDYADMPLAKALQRLKDDDTPEEAYELNPPAGGGNA